MPKAHFSSCFSSTKFLVLKTKQDYRTTARSCRISRSLVIELHFYCGNGEPVWPFYCLENGFERSLQNAKMCVSEVSWFSPKCHFFTKWRFWLKSNVFRHAHLGDVKRSFKTIFWTIERPHRLAITSIKTQINHHTYKFCNSAHRCSDNFVLFSKREILGREAGPEARLRYQ